MKEPVSVIICARNEEENLKKNLPQILDQDYPDFEVIVVNDCSTDNSMNMLAEFKRDYPNFKYTNIDEEEDFYHGKKLGLTVGIKAAKNDLLVLTDADCYPASKKWIACMAKEFDEKTEIVLGYGGYEPGKGLLNKLIQFDTLTIAMQYMGFAAHGLAYMGVGRNLAYRKSTFLRNKGFASHNKILSGDDDLLVNEIATNQNTKYTLHTDSHIISTPKESFKAWLIQKSRHLSTGKYYQFKHKLMLAVEIISRLFFYLTFLFMLLLSSYVYYVMAVFGIRMILQLILYKTYMNKLGVNKILFFSPFFDFVIPIINLYLFITSYLTQRNIKWK